MGQEHELKHIAVIGMGCRLPGDVDSPAALWRLLIEERDAVTEPPPGRERQRFGEDRLPPHGGYLSDISGFDADFFGVSGKEADVLDPQHRLLLEVAWEALEHAGLPPEHLSGTATGLFVGLSYTDYMDALAGGPQELEGSVLTNGQCVAAGRISYLLGLQGPSLALDTACSSSLVALHLACQALRNDECDLALAGGVTLMLHSRTTRSFTRMGMLSAGGRCRTFDASADGFVRGEGCAAVVLKRLPDALREGDRILAVIRGSAVNQDGRSDGLAAPSAHAQQALYRQALARAAVDPRQVGYIETHGTGTPIGDPVEFQSVSAVYGKGQGRCALGSVKTNLGHLEPAAGVVGFIKAVLCIRHGMVPANLHFTSWNPAISADGTRLFVPTQLSCWPTRTPVRLAAVSSFGFSGTNAHVILEQAPERRSEPLPGRKRAKEAPPEVFLVGAGSRAALPGAAQRLSDWLQHDGSAASLRDVAHTLALRRSAGHGRLGVVASTRPELISALEAFQNGRAHPGVVSGSVGAGVTRRPVWVFSGQGSQWQGMTRDLLHHEPAFEAALTETDGLIAAEAGFSVLELLRSGRKVSGCARVQPVLFAVQTALAAAWRAHGVEPAAVLGHSMGEVAAAVCAGALTPYDGVKVICRRSALLSRIAGAGAMASVNLDVAAVKAELAAAGAAGSVCIAVLAAPDSTVVSGDPLRIRRLVTTWQNRGLAAQLIAVDVASHCPQVDRLLPHLAGALADLAPRQPELPFYTTVLDDPRETPLFDAPYWCANLRRPVRFAAAVAAAAVERHQIFLEISPQPVVTRAVSQTLADLPCTPVVLPTLRREENEPFTFRTQLAALHCAGVDVDWYSLYADDHLVDAPTLTFNRTGHWIDSVDVPPVQREDAPAALPGTHVHVPGAQPRECWHGDAGTDTLPWLADHRVHGTPALPGAASCALALTAACEVFAADAHTVEATDIVFHRLLHLAGNTPVSTTVTCLGPDRAEFEVFSPDAHGEWAPVASALLRRALPARDTPPLPPAETSDRHPVELDPAALYASLRSRGLEHGPAFSGVTALRTTAERDSFWARVEVPAPASAGRHDLRIHPVLLDLCAQLVVAGLIGDTDSGPLLPVRIKRLRLLADPVTARYGQAVVTRSDANAITGEVRLTDETGRVVAEAEGIHFVRRPAAERTSVDDWFLETTWEPAGHRHLDTAVAARTWLVICEADDSGRVLADALRAGGATAAVISLDEAASLEQLTETLRGHWNPPAAAPAAVVLLCKPSGDSDDPTDPTTTAERRVRQLLAVAQAAIAADDPPRVYAVTRAAQDLATGRPADPLQAPLRGMIRVLAFEHPELHATLVDADGTPGGLETVAGELLAWADEDEVALRAATRHVARLTYRPLSPAERTKASTRTVRYGADGFRLHAARLGDLGALQLGVSARQKPGPGEVELRVQAAGMNFRDVLTTMGLLSTDEAAGHRIGFECAGVITALGPGVNHLNVGDKVLAVDLEGGVFASFTTVPATLAVPLPDSLTTDAAAGAPIAFLTAWYALRHLARLAEGERVLIHSATGGTGLAAVAIARQLGGEVFATAGTQAKREYLHDMGIRHVMDSRSLDFARQVRDATAGEGVDVVLNSLTGRAIRAGLEALRPLGRFVELGVRDIAADSPLGLGALRHNITMSAVDLIELQRERPHQFAGLLQEVVQELRQGRLSPLPTQTHSLEHAQDAFMQMAAAAHIGKLVLTVPDDGATTATLPQTPPPVRPDGSYLVTGGLRGVGLATADWLSRQGARRLVLNGRTAPGPQAQAQLERIRRRGTEITVELGDAGEPGTAQRLVAAATEGGLRLRGVVHAAMVLDDAAIANITDDQLHRVWHPKVSGACQLHLATQALRPDWFVLHSSMASLLGNPGQGAYAAANAWLDAFASWRSALGLRTLAVNWGPWGETGVATGFAERGYQTIATSDGMQALATLLTHGRIRTGVIPGDPRSWIHSTGRSSSLFARLTQSTAAPGGDGAARDDVVAGLRSAASGMARRIALEQYLTSHIRGVLRLQGTDIDPQTPLRALGFDSLLRIELRARLETGLGVKLGNDFVAQHPTLAALATGIASRLDLHLGGEDTPDPGAVHTTAPETPPSTHEKGQQCSSHD
ncbi:type I polyketide synthase [Streptacidiphilus melanogenes]|uniref:type I polyketide synthase n=1 Tax=Streptacidiphilus melanogenes TaxID=411235 RepID=UPI0007C812C6|nr:type I polyketide synthase [Streptacidiphilus melanogenes]